MNQPTIEKMRDIIKVIDRRFDSFSWFPHDEKIQDAATGDYWFPLKKQYIHISYAFGQRYQVATVYVIEKDGQKVAEYSVFGEGALFRNMMNIINRFPERRKEMDALYENLMSELDALEKKAA